VIGFTEFYPALVWVPDPDDGVAPLEPDVEE
jgi:hypothetical protein